MIQQKVELQEKENELQKNQSLLEQANNAINDLKKQLQEEIRLKDHALAGKFTFLSIMKVLLLKYHNELNDNLDLSNLEDQLNRSVDENSRLKKSVERARDDGRRNREKIAVDFEHTENRLNDSLRENDRKI